MWEPFGRAPENNTAYWKEGPNGRGTFSILSTCLITLSLCVYTSLHLNIPEHGKTYWGHQFWKRAWWVFLGVATPEFIAYIAIRDWLFARNFDEDMKQTLALVTPSSTLKTSSVLPDVKRGVSAAVVERENGHGNTITQVLERIASTQARSVKETTRPALRHSSTQMNSYWSIPSGRKHLWTRTHSYFALMGGFAVDTSDMSVNVLSQGRTRGTLTVSAIKAIAENAPMVLPDLSKKEIDDKSKASGLAKLLVCLQASWFCAQMLGRLATDGNPISLLELNTFLHAICCLATYGAWWRKPLDISEPELVNAASKEEQLHFYARVCLGKELHCTPCGPESKARKFNAALNQEALSSGPRNIVAYHDNYTFAFESSDVTQDLEAAIERLGQDKYQIVLRLYHQQTCFGYYLRISPNPGPLEVWAELRWADIECLRLANDLSANAIPLNPEKPKTRWRSAEPLAVFVNHASMVDSPDGTLKRFKPSKSVTTDKAKRFGNLDPVDMVLWFSLMLAGAFYGGVHLLAWNGPFHTKKEQWMWRVSCIIIASPPVAAPLLYAYAAAMDKFTRYDSWAERFGLATSVITAVVFVLVYSAARVCLVVECFINLSHLPLEVYKEPAWSRYIPHFSAG